MKSDSSSGFIPVQASLDTLSFYTLIKIWTLTSMLCPGHNLHLRPDPKFPFRK